MIKNPNPGGCRWCGIDRQRHYQTYHGPDLGSGGFVDPTQEQIKERMFARREARMSLSDRAQTRPDEVSEIIDFIEKNFPDNWTPPYAN